MLLFFNIFREMLCSLIFLFFFFVSELRVPLSFALAIIRTFYIWYTHGYTFIKRAVTQLRFPL